MTELKPCPFCGSKEVYESPQLCVVCADCKAHGPMKVEDVRKAWNTRHYEKH